MGELFTIPLTSVVALLSFAHGSNDVANAVGLSGDSKCLGRW